MSLLRCISPSFKYVPIGSMSLLEVCPYWSTSLQGMMAPVMLVVITTHALMNWCMVRGVAFIGCHKMHLVSSSELQSPAVQFSLSALMPSHAVALCGLPILAVLQGTQCPPCSRAHCSIALLFTPLRSHGQCSMRACAFGQHPGKVPALDRG